MNDIGVILIGAVAGAIMGGVFFGGLWLTTQKSYLSKNPALTLLSSFAGRMLFCLGGFYLVIRFTGLTGIVSSMVLFLAIQVVFTRRSLSGG